MQFGLRLVVFGLGLATPVYAMAQDQSPRQEYSLADFHQLLISHDLSSIYVISDQMTYFIEFNAPERLLRIRGRHTSDTHTDSRVESASNAILKAEFDSGSSELTFVSHGTVFGDDDYDYFAALGKSVEVADRISPEHRDHYSRIIDTVGRLISRSDIR